MLSLRYYQQEAHDAVFKYWAIGGGSPLVVLPTGTGKALCIANMVRELVTAYPSMRVVMLTHSRELVRQNYKELLTHWPEAPAGMYSAGLKKRDLKSRIIFAGIQSIASKAYELQRCDLIIVDEAHAIPRKSATLYGRFLADTEKINPGRRLLGYTATPYRMDSGYLHTGDDALFTDIVYEYPVSQAIDDGFLAPVTTRRTKTEYDLSGLKKVAGDFSAKQMEQRFDTDALNEAVVDEVISVGIEEGRKKWIIFASGVDHAHHLQEIMTRKGVACGVVVGETEDRDGELSRYSDGSYRCIISVGILTTGFNEPSIDLLVLLRATESCGLYIQMVGRGTRLFPGKTDCRVMDFAGNIARHGPIDVAKPKDKKNGGGGKPPMKECTECTEFVLAGVRICPHCGHEFPPPEALPAYHAVASRDAILSRDIIPSDVSVSSVIYSKHEKAGKPPTLKVTYSIPLGAISEWIAFEGSGFARVNAVKWWAAASGGTIPPATVDEAISRKSELLMPKEISILKVGKYPEIKGRVYSQ